MASMVDRGDSYHVIYLGSCMMSQMSTGLGVLQKPLRELYFKYRQAGGGPAAQERYLLVSGKGMTMTYKESASSNPTEVFYSMPNILFWDAVQFVTVRSADKKVRGAFEPLDNDHSRNKDNLFAPIDKRYFFLQQMTHPPLFACVLRRTQGVKALDVHAFVCSSDEEALSLLRALNIIQHNYKADENLETGVFGYRPFSKDSGGHGDPASALSESSKRYSHSSTSLNIFPMMGSGSMESRPLSRAVSQRQLASNSTEGQGHGDDQGLFVTSSQSTRQTAASPNKSGGGQTQRIYQLTQKDFLNHIQRPGLKVGAGGELGGGSTEHLEVPREGDADTEERNEHVYQYIKHLEHGPPRKEDRGVVGSRPQPNNRSPVKGVATAVQRNRENKQQQQQQPQVRNTIISKNVELLESTISNSLNRLAAQYQKVDKSKKTSHGALLNNPDDRGSVRGYFQQGQNGKLGQGYTLLSGSGSPLPGQIDRSREYPGDDESEEGEPPPLPPPRIRTNSMGYDSYLSSPENTIPRPRVTPNYRDYDYSDRESQRSVPSSQSQYGGSSASPAGRITENAHLLWASANEGPPGGMQPPSYSDLPGRREVPPEPRRALPVTSRRAPDDSTPQPQQRPVAKVPPHHRTGIKVLPTGVQGRNSTRSPTERPKSAFYHDEMGYSSGSGQKTSSFGHLRKAKSQYFDDQAYHQHHNSSDKTNGSSSPNAKNPYESNWHFTRPQQAEDYEYRTMSAEEMGEDKTLSDKLLLGKKKDAEIAAVMQNIRFDYDGTTISPGLPAGNNFEKSLGYFP